MFLRRHGLAVPVALAALLGCGPKLAARPGPNDLPDSDEYTIYSAVLTEHFSRNPLALIGDTELWPSPPEQSFLAGLRDGAPAEDRELLDDLIAKLTWPRVGLENWFTVPVAITLVPRATLDALLALQPGDTSNQDGVRRFHAQYPGLEGPMNLFRIGYNSERTRALVFARDGPCGSMCGELVVASVRFDGKSWVYERDFFHAIS